MAQAICRGLSSKAKIGGKLLKSPADSIERLIPSATLVQTAKFDYAKPWNYKKLSFGGKLGPLYFLLDYPLKRMNPNSKLIIVEGNLAVGKNDFAQRLAKEFDLLYVPSVAENEIFQHKNGFDLRVLNDGLLDFAKFYDLEEFYADKNLKDNLVRLNCMQRGFFLKKCYYYAQSIQHILNTGQGVVLTSSVFGEPAYINALKQLGLLDESEHGYAGFSGNGLEAILKDGLKPHATIYLEASIESVRQRINARNDAREVKSEVLSDAFLQSIDDGYQENVLPTLRGTGELIEIDWSKPNDAAFKEVVNELADHDLSKDDKKFKEWDASGFRLNRYRQLYSMMATNTDLGLNLAIPDQAYNHPAIKYKNGWAPEFGNNVTFKLF